MDILISKNDKSLKGEIILPGSKSESNRALILQALSRNPVEIRNLSEAEDTVTLHNLLKSRSLYPVLDVGPAGTAMRFLTAFCAVTEGEWVLTGTRRMKERPIGLLVDALRSLGADIEYLENKGFPPLKIKGGVLDKAAGVSIPADVSSQYISALLMIAPGLPGGLTLHLTGPAGSRPYIEMTLSMLGELSIEHSWKGTSIHIPRQDYQPATLHIEPDWSGASYWYSMAALCEEVDLSLPYLKKYSLQGDSVIAEIMANFGVQTRFTEDGIRLAKVSKPFGKKELDFLHCPDLAQTVLACCTALKHDAVFTGLESLKIKETDRVAALQHELGKFGACLTETGAGERWVLDTGAVAPPPAPPAIHTYHDHRMAMALAPLAARLGPLVIEDKSVTSKSYPGYWKDLEKVGFTVKEYTSIV